MESVLLGLPETIKEMIYVEALKHISNAMLALPLDSSVRKLTAQSVAAYAMDVAHLVEFVGALPEKDLLMSGLDELRQTTDLMTLAAEGKGEEFFDSSISGKRFPKVDKIKGAELLEKVTPAELMSTPTLSDGHEHFKKPSMANFGDFRDRFGKFTQRDRS